MSSSFLNFYEISHIPCSPNANDHTATELGLATVSIDGKHIKGGVGMNGQCYFGGLSVGGSYQSPTGQFPGQYSIFFLPNVAYAVGGQATVNNANTGKMQRMNFGL